MVNVNLLIYNLPATDKCIQSQQAEDPAVEVWPDRSSLKGP